jgi:hypothetical protein
MLPLSEGGDLVINSHWRITYRKRDKLGIVDIIRDFLATDGHKALDHGDELLQEQHPEDYQTYVLKRLEFVEREDQHDNPTG